MDPNGDKRILMINGEPVPYALARVPLAGETRGNLAAGGKGEGLQLNERDYWICEQLSQTLKEKGLLERLLLAMDLEGIALSRGSACASGTAQPSGLLLAMGLPLVQAAQALRISFGPQTEEGHVGKILDVLDRMAP